MGKEIVIFYVIRGLSFFMPGRGAEYNSIICWIFLYPPNFQNYFLYPPKMSLKIFIPPSPEISGKTLFKSKYLNLGQLLMRWSWSNHFFLLIYKGYQNTTPIKLFNISDSLSLPLPLPLSPRFSLSLPLLLSTETAFFHYLCISWSKSIPHGDMGPIGWLFFSANSAVTGVSWILYIWGWHNSSEIVTKWSRT